MKLHSRHLSVFAIIALLAPVLHAAPAATSLPEVSVPTMPAPTSSAATAGTLPMKEIPASAPAAPSVSPGPAAAPAPALPPKQYSYGDSGISLLFLSDQMEKLKEAIRLNEDMNPAALVTFETGEGVRTAEEKIIEPVTYPVFFLSSIVYKGPSDWAVWVSGYKITPHKNETDVKIVSVTRDNVTFTWQPTYSKLIALRNESHKFAPTDAVKHKLSVAQSAAQAPDTGMIVFTLRQNQSFAVGYFKIFEGYVDGPTSLPPLSDPAVAQSGVVTGGQPIGPTPVQRPGVPPTGQSAQQMVIPSTVPAGQMPVGAAGPQSPTQPSPAMVGPATPVAPTNPTR